MIPSNQESHEVPTTTRRKKLTTIIFDTDFFFRPKTRLLIKTHGLQGVAIYQAAVCWAAYEESSATLDAATFELFALDLGLEVEEVFSVLERCAELGFLSKIPCGYFSDRLELELAAINQKQNNYHSGAVKREAAKRNKTETNLAEQEPNLVSCNLSLKQNPAQSCKSVHVRKEQEEEQEQEKEKEQDQEREQEPPDPPTEPEKPKLRLHVPEKPKPILEFEHPLAELASSALVSSQEPALVIDPVYVATQRRPMRKYPEIYLTLPELCDVFEQAEKAGLPRSEMGMLFKPIAAECADRIRKGQSLVNFKTYIWLTGYALDNALTKYKKSLDVKRAESFAKAGDVK